MNAPLQLAAGPTVASTNAAEGLPRRRFTVVEIERMVAAGILPEERIELIGGDVVVMSAKGNQHELVKAALTEYWARRMPATYRLVTETTFRLTPDTYLEPDFVIYPKSSGIPGLSPQTVGLVVEISDSSLGYDLGRKAHLYAGFGIAELWVIDAVRLCTHVHRAPEASGYADIQEFAAGVRVVPVVSPDLGVVLAELELM